MICYVKQVVKWSERLKLAREALIGEAHVIVEQKGE